MDGELDNKASAACASRAARFRIKEQTFNISVVLLCVLGALTAVGPIYRATFLAQIETNEGWVAYYVDAILKGHPLYPSPGQLITNNYPPLFFYLDALATRFTGNALFAGRALSFIALLLITLAIFLVLRLLGVRRLFAFISAVVYFATMCRLFDGYVAVNDPQLTAHAVMMFGLYCFLRACNAKSRWFAVPAALMVTAGFIKHNVLAVPISALVFLIRRDRQSAIRFALVGIGLGLAGLAVCAAIYGADFTFNLFGPRPYHWARGFKAFEDLHRVAVQFILWVCFALTVKDGERARLVNILCVVSFVESFIVRGGDEVDKNAGFDFVIAINLALGLIFEHVGDLGIKWLGPSEFRTAAICMIIVRLLFGEPMDSFNVWYGPAMARWYGQAERMTVAEAACVARISGPVGCDSPLTCFLAGKPFTVDPATLSIRIGAGRVPRDILDRQVAAGSLTYVPDTIGTLRPYGPARKRYAEDLRTALEPIGRYLSPPSSPIFSDRRNYTLVAEIWHKQLASCLSADSYP